MPILKAIGAEDQSGLARETTFGGSTCWGEMAQSLCAVARGPVSGYLQPVHGRYRVPEDGSVETMSNEEGHEAMAGGAREHLGVTRGAECLPPRGPSP